MQCFSKRISALVLSVFLFSTLLTVGAPDPARASVQGTTRTADDRLIVNLIDRAHSCAGLSYPGSSVITRGSYILVLRVLNGGRKSVPPQQQPLPDNQTRPIRDSRPQAAPIAPQPDPKPQQDPVPQKSPAPQKAPAAPGLDADEQRMLDMVNSARAKSGLKPLSVDMDLSRLARKKGRDMIDKNYFDHNSPTYGTPFDMMKAAGQNYRYAGENLAGAPSVDTAHTSLMNSPGHRANILNPNYTQAGIGVVSGGRYGKMFVQMFTG
ncbi:MAG: CAP domain-containing protein [Desulfocucumaceae bacterium]